MDGAVSSWCRSSGALSLLVLAAMEATVSHPLLQIGSIVTIHTCGFSLPPERLAVLATSFFGGVAREDLQLEAQPSNMALVRGLCRNSFAKVQAAFADNFERFRLV